MEHLNDDCLYEIFKYLPLKNQLILAKVCEQFQRVIVTLMWKRYYHEVNTENFLKKYSVNNEQFNEFFKLNVENLKTFILTDEPEKYTFRGTETSRWWPNFLYFFSFTFPQLRKFTCMHKRFDDGYMELVAKRCPSLEELHLKSNHVTGKHIKHLSNLRKLYVNTLENEYLLEILTNLPITHLELLSFSSLPLPSQVIEKLGHLEELTLGGDLLSLEFIEVFVRCGKIRSFTVNIPQLYFSSQIQLFFLTFFEKAAKHMRQIELFTGTSRNDFLTYFIKLIIQSHNNPLGIQTLHIHNTAKSSADEVTLGNLGEFLECFGHLNEIHFVNFVNVYEIIDLMSAIANGINKKLPSKESRLFQVHILHDNSYFTAGEIEEHAISLKHRFVKFKIDKQWYNEVKQCPNISFLFKY